jgi:hypothetical protein
MKKSLTLLSLGLIIGIVIFCLTGNNCRVFSKNEAQINQELFAKYGNQIYFSADFKPQEKELVLNIIDQSLLPSLDIFGQIYFSKTDDENLQAVSSGAGLIKINTQFLKEGNSKKIKRAVGHEMGHLFDYFVLTNEDRKEFAKLRKLGEINDIHSDWFSDYDLKFQDISDDKWRHTPAEDLAEIFYVTFFDENETIRTDFDKQVSEEVKQFLKDRYSEALENSDKYKKYQLTFGAYQKLSQLSQFASNQIKIINLPQHYGSLLYMFKRADEEEEYVFVSISRQNQDQHLYYYYKPNGYDQYESYFQKAADEIIYYDKTNYYVLFKQGKAKDFTLVSNGQMVLMTNDKTITKYDLIVMIEEGKKFIGLELL